MSTCFFVSDLHGHTSRYQKLFQAIAEEKPAGVFIGGDILPSRRFMPPSGKTRYSFIADFLEGGFRQLKRDLGALYPQVYIILGNDDPRSEEAGLLLGESKKLWTYMHNKRVSFGGLTIYGYACVPPTPFRLKDWERYDISHYIDPGCIPLEEGFYTVSPSESEIAYGTIQDDLQQLVHHDPLAKAIFLFHTPPYQTCLDRAALDGKTVEHVALDIHVGSIAVKRFIQERQPLITLHGHIHESARLTGSWQERIGQTFLFSAAHDGNELALVRFDPSSPETASRQLL